MYRCLFLILLSFALAEFANARLLISEIVASASDQEDWIEIHNSGEDVVDLTAYTLTTDPDNLAQWLFPARSLAPGGYLVVTASGEDRQNPPHTNFKLPREGGFLALVRNGEIVDSLGEQYPRQFRDVSYGRQTSGKVTALVNGSSTYDLLIPSLFTPLPEDWNQLGYVPDDIWTRARLPIGYTEESDYPEIQEDVAARMDNRSSSLFLRTIFSMEQLPGVMDQLLLRVSFDDGFVLYLNGEEVVRRNAEDPLNKLTLASTGVALPVQEQINLTDHLSQLRVGENEIAIHGLNAAKDDTDFYFDMELTVVGAGDFDRESWRYFENPTPGSPNAGGRTDHTRHVLFSEVSGFIEDGLGLTLSRSGDEGTIHYTLDGSVPTVVSPIYDAPLSIETSTQVRAILAVPGEDDSQITATRLIRLSPELSGFESSLPIMVFHNFGAGDIPNKRAHNPPAGDGGGITQVPRQSSLMAFVDRNSRLSESEPLLSRAGIRVRGSSSSNQPKGKQSLSIEAWNEKGEELAIAPFEMPEESDWGLYAPYRYDRALIRNSLVYELYRQMGHYAPRTQLVEVFINTEGGDLTNADRVGVFTFMEKVKRDRDRVAFSRMSQEGTTGGWLLQSQRKDPMPADGSGVAPYNFHTAGPNRTLQGPYGGSSGADRGGDDIPAGYNTFLNFVSPKGYDSTSAQREAIMEWFVRFEDTLYGEDYRDPEKGYQAFLDLPSFIDHYWMVDFSRNVDGLALSTYLYLPEQDGKLHMGPVWDYDRTLGSYDGRVDNTTSGFFGRDRLWYARLFDDPEFVQAAQDRWQTHRLTVFSDENLNGLIDRFADEITNDVAAFNFERWSGSNNRPRGSQWRNEIEHLRDWVLDRAAWLDKQFEPLPRLDPPSGTIANDKTVQIRLPSIFATGTVYFTTDGSDPRGPGGVITGQPFEIGLVITEEATVRARIKNGDVWSGLVSGTYMPVESNITGWLVEFGLTEADLQSDPDEDGANNYAEYLFGTDPFKRSLVPVTLHDQSTVSILTWSGDDVDVSLEGSSNLQDWNRLEIAPGTEDLGNGFNRHTFSFPQIDTTLFLRFHLRPTR